MKAAYKIALDTTAEELKRTCCSLRRVTKTDRLLLHYNGHGVPKPTENGEMWVFGRGHTHYMPLSVIDLRQWCGDPAIYVVDCSCAGRRMPFFLETMKRTDGTAEPNMTSSAFRLADRHPVVSHNGVISLPRTDTNGGPLSYDSNIVLLACRAGEELPTNPKFPADIFTACLTTPIHMAVRWFISQVSTKISTIGSYW